MCIGTQDGNAEADFADYLIEDHEIRTFVKEKLYKASISKIEIKGWKIEGCYLDI